MNMQLGPIFIPTPIPMNRVGSIDLEKVRIDSFPEAVASVMLMVLCICTVIVLTAITIDMWKTAMDFVDYVLSIMLGVCALIGAGLFFALLSMWFL